MGITTQNLRLTFPRQPFNSFRIATCYGTTFLGICIALLILETAEYSAHRKDGRRSETDVLQNNIMMKY